MTYRYYDIGKYLVCLEQSVMDALLQLVAGYDRNSLSSLGVTKSAARNMVKFLVKSRLKSRSAKHFERLPVFGHIGMKVHRGFKVFNFDDSSVTKVFAAGVSPLDAEQELAASREASALSKAPRFIASGPGANWFSEEYIRGTHATNLVAANSGDYLRFYADVEECLLDLLECKPPIVIDAAEHINNLADNDYCSRWLEAGFTGQDLDGIRTYLEGLSSWLVDNLASETLQLTRTHGDFSLVNAISTDSGLRFIDWEGIGPGSLYTDIYNFAFAERYYGRSSPDFISEVATVIERFRGAVLNRQPGLQQSASMNQVIARRLYYLERVRLMVNREASQNLYNVILKSIAMFNDFDKEIGDSPI